jgi:hypothetical protein
MTDESTAEKWTEENWVYLGESPNIAGAHRWRDEAGNPMSFKGAKARVPGGIYTVKCERHDGTITLYGTQFTYTGARAEDAGSIQLQAMAVESKLKAERLNRNTSRTGAIDETLSGLLDIAKGLKTYSDRRALADYVLAKIYDAD